VFFVLSDNLAIPFNAPMIPMGENGGLTVFILFSYGFFRSWRLSDYNDSRKMVGEKPEHRMPEKFACSHAGTSNTQSRAKSAIDV
jgi:hypothetical protein